MSILYMGNGETNCVDANWEDGKNGLTDTLSIEPANCELGGGPRFYVSQDNYLYTELTNNPIKLYCDSATSCIIIVVTGSNKNKKKSVLMSHLSRPGRFNNFFRLVKENFQNDVNIYAAGANPPEPCVKKDGSFDYTALNNAKQVAAWISGQSVAAKLLSVRFGEGNPSVYSNNLDCLSVDISSENIKVSNERIELTDYDRDPTGGAQTLFCMFADPSVIRHQFDPFSKTETDSLVSAARSKDFQKAAGMSDKEILNTYSSTPDFEVPWFCSTIRKAGEYTKNYKF